MSSLNNEPYVENEIRKFLIQQFLIQLGLVAQSNRSFISEMQYEINLSGKQITYHRR